jgi:predicted nucleic acid-binding protein
MVAYPDTSFLCALYRPQMNSLRAARHVASMREPLHVASPLLFEFRQSARWQSWLHSKDATKGFPQQEAQAMLSRLQANIAQGALVIAPVEWADVVSVAERLSARHTWSRGHRGFDVLHVATALHLGSVEFLTFDIHQKELAESEGLRVPMTL